MNAESLAIAVGVERIAAVLHLPSGRGPAPCVVASHGLAASKDSDKYLQLAERLVRVGIACCRYDFRGSGESEGRYADTTVETRIEDLKAVLGCLRGRPTIDGRRIGLFGSSFGGFVSHFVAKEEPAPALVTWGTPATLSGMERLATEEVVSLGPGFFAELSKGGYRETPEGVARLLVVHGDRDDVVPVDHAKRLWERAVDPKALSVLEGGDHRFLDPGLRQRAMDQTVEWFLRYLQE
jgi:fermentation-respiration switch protein FrsA (DUF1100 family)